MNWPDLPTRDAVRAGLTVVAEDGRRYVTTTPKGSTLVRATPKIRGKAARRADKRARRLARART